jgi:membrane protease subunit HflC
MVRLIIGVVALVLFGLYHSAFVMNEWEQGIITQFGRHLRTIQEPGLYFKVPLLHALYRMDKRVLVTDAQVAEYLTADKKRVEVDHISRWRITDPLEFYRTVRDEHGASARLDDIIVARLRQEIAKQTFLDLVREKREHVMAAVTADTHEMATSFGIGDIDVRIKRVDLPKEVQPSVFARMRAERERIAKRYRAEGEEQAREIRAGADKDREIIVAKAYGESQRLTGEGDARATTVYAQAYGQDPEFYSFTRRLQAYEKIFAQGATVMLQPDSELLRYLESSGVK